VKLKATVAVADFSRSLRAIKIQVVVNDVKEFALFIDGRHITGGQPGGASGGYPVK
jgi:hypothetical protein